LDSGNHLILTQSQGDNISITVFLSAVPGRVEAADRREHNTKT
jgi:hypothetical protein